MQIRDLPKEILNCFTVNEKKNVIFVITIVFFLIFNVVVVLEQLKTIMDDLKLVDALIKSNQPDSLKEALASKYLLRIAEKDLEKE